jgi:hypothetical protein
MRRESPSIEMVEYEAVGNFKDYVHLDGCARECDDALPQKRRVE